jgi:hypothetical protein
MTSSLAYIPRGSIPYTQHWNGNCNSSSFSKITDTSCPPVADNYSRYYSALTGLVNTLFASGIARPTTNYTTISEFNLTSNRAMTSAELGSGIVFVTPDASTPILTMPTASSLVTELQTLFTAGINDNFSYYLTIVNKSAADSFVFTSNAAFGGTVAHTIAPLTSVLYLVNITSVSTPAFYLQDVTPVTP